MKSTEQENGEFPQTLKGPEAAAEWRSLLTGATNALLLFEALTGLSIYFLPFSEFNQFGVLLHTLAGLMMLLPVGWFLLRHWWVRKKGSLSHYQLLGYLSLALLLVCVLSGLVLTWQGIAGPAIDTVWDLLHLFTGLGLTLILIVHLVSIVTGKSARIQVQQELRGARRRFYLHTAVGCGLLLLACGLWVGLYGQAPRIRGFADDYNWRFGDDRPFAPSMARLDDSEWKGAVQRQLLQVLGEQDRSVYLAAFEEWKKQPIGLFAQVRHSTDGLELEPRQRQEIEAILDRARDGLRSAGSVYPRALAGSAACGKSGCHQEIYQEWLPSAHRYSSMDHMFQRVQAIMVDETAPEFTRYCAGCHDPISLFSGAKDPGNVTLSAEGSNEGSSCVVCHSVVQTDIQGNGDYTVRPPRPYVYEWDEGPLAGLLSDFLIRTYPRHHIRTYARPLYKAAEFCAACHKQYVDREVNVDIGKVQGQNQYDSWKNSRWYHEGDPRRTVTCRECHMPLMVSDDPARGETGEFNRGTDDGRHRSHRMLASNQYIPVDQGLEGGEEHAALIEQWLRGEIEIPEIADKWTSGPVVRMAIDAPEKVAPGEEVRIQVILTNNKTGHDFPTGPLDMIESWVELRVSDSGGNTIHHVGGLDEKGSVQQPPVMFKADGFDRKGELIDRHNLWDMVGASYKRVLYPGVTDTVAVRFQCPSMARGRLATGDQEPGRRSEGFAFQAPAKVEGEQLRIAATLWYRKANPEFLDRIYGADKGLRSPLTDISHATASIRIAKEQVDHVE